MRKPTKLISKWLFETIAGTFVENGILYTPDSYGNGAVVVPGNYEDGTLTLDDGVIADGKIFPLVVKSELKAPYIVYDSFRTTFTSSKDGVFPETVTFRLLIVGRTYNEVEVLTEAVESVIIGKDVDNAGEVRVTEDRSDYDANTGEFVEEIHCLINL